MIFDKSSRQYDQDGRLHVERTVISLANVCPYYGAEIPNAQEMGLDPGKIYKLYRDPAELEAAAPTYHNIPLLIKHVAVSAEAPKKDSIVGCVSNITFENPRLYGSIAAWTQEGIDLIESGEQEQLSAGYYFTADMTPGVTPEGEAFDGRMRNLKANHVALVKEGRVGPESAIADQLPPELSSMPATSKYPHLAKFLPAGADLQAFDKAMDEEKEKAEDEANGCYGKTKDEWESMSAADKKKARDSWKDDDEKDVKDGKAKDGAAEEEGVSKPVKGEDHAITRVDIDALLAADRAMQRSVIMTAVQDLSEAREAVKPLVGQAPVMDSAEAVYIYALGKSGIDGKGWPLAALKANVESLKRTTSVKPATKPVHDAAAVSIGAIFPGLSRFNS